MIVFDKVSKKFPLGNFALNEVSFEIDNLFGTDYGDPSVDREGRTFMGKVNLTF